MSTANDRQRALLAEVELEKELNSLNERRLEIERNHGVKILLITRYAISCPPKETNLRFVKND